MHIGNEPVFSDNPKCAGGPFLADNYEDYYDDAGNVQKMIPAFGFEAYCNMPGRYTFFNPIHIPQVYASICSVGVMGTRYLRD